MFSKSKRYSYPPTQVPHLTSVSSDKKTNIKGNSNKQRRNTFSRQSAENRTFVIRRSADFFIQKHKSFTSKGNQTFKKIASTISKTFSPKSSNKMVRVDKEDHTDDLYPNITWEEFQKDMKRDSQNCQNDDILIDDVFASDAIKDTPRRLAEVSEDICRLSNEQFSEIGDESKKGVINLDAELAVFNKISLYDLQNQCRNSIEKLSDTVNEVLTKHVRTYTNNEYQSITTTLQEQLEETRQYIGNLANNYKMLLDAADRKLEQKSILIETLREEINDMDLSICRKETMKKQCSTWL